MPLQTLTRLKANPKYQALSPKDQMGVAEYYLKQELATIPAYQTANTQTKAAILRKNILMAPTFEDEVYYGGKARGLMEKVRIGKTGSGLEKGIYEGWVSSVQNSGILATGAALFDASGVNPLSNDRKRSLEYFKAADNVLRRDDWAGEIGAVLGNVADIVAVSLVMSPLTGAARAAAQVAAKGGKAAVAAATAKGLTPAIMKPLLHTFGPIAAEAAIEAIPYYITNELKLAANGQPSTASKGMAEVAKTLGINAAADFLVGSALSAAAWTLFKGGKALFGPGYKRTINMTDEKVVQDMLDNIATGKSDPSILQTLDPYTRDRVYQAQGVKHYIDKGVFDPGSSRFAKAHYLAHDTGSVIGKNPDTGAYRLWNMDDEGRVLAKEYTSLNDLEDTLAYKGYQAYMAKAPEVRDRFFTGHPDALKRGEALVNQEIALGNVSTLATDPLIASRLRSTDVIKPASKRSVITQGEAQSLLKMNNGTFTAIQAKIPLTGTITEAANKGDLHALRGNGPIRVSAHDTPNAVFIGTKAAPANLYEEATALAQKSILEDPMLDLEGTRASLLMDKGFDHMVHPDGSVEFFSPHNMKLIGELNDIVSKPLKENIVGPLSTQTIVTESKHFRLSPAGLRKNDTISTAAAIKAMRSTNSSELPNFAKLYASENGENLEVILDVTHDATAPVVSRAGNVLTIKQTPKNMTYAEERKFFDELMTGLQKNTTGGKPTKAANYWASKFTSTSEAFTLPKNSRKPEWIQDVVTRLGGSAEITPQGITLKLPSGAKSFATPEDAITYLSRRIGDESLIANDLMRQGIRLMDTKTGKRAISYRTKQLMAEGATLGDVLDQLGYSPVSIDMVFGPKTVKYSPDGIEFGVFGSTVYKTPEDAFKDLQKFVNTRDMASKRILGTTSDGDFIVLPNGEYEVYLSQFKSKKHFDNIQDARKYLANSADLPIKDLQEMADSKFAKLYIENNQYVLYSGPNRYTANTMDELKTQMSKIPDIEDHVPSILDELDSSIEASVADLAHHAKARNKYRPGANAANGAPEFVFDPKVTAMNFVDAMGAATESFTGWVENIMKHTGNVQLGKQVAAIQNGVRVAMGETVTGNRLLKGIFQDSKGKQFGIDSRTRIFYHLAGQNAEDAAVLAGQYAVRYKKSLTALNAEETIAAGRIKEYLKNLSIKFGIDSEKFIFHYMPHLRDMHHAANADLLANVVTADDLVRRLTNAEPSKEVKFWAEHERVEEVTRFMLKDDALEVLMLYTAQGNKKFYINEPWKAINRFMTESKLAATDPGIMNRVNMYRMNIMGSYHTPGEKIVEDFGAKLFLGIKRLPGIGKLIPFSEAEMEKAGQQILRSTLSLTYFSSMGWKPFLAVRNAMQPLTLTAPRIGLDWVTRAYKEVLDNPKDIYDRLIRKNVLAEKPPVVNQFFGEGSISGKLMESSLYSFKNSDDLTRAVAYIAAEKKFNNALSALQNNQITTQKAFFEMSGLDVVDPVTQGKAWAEVQAKNYEVASDVFANKIQHDSMFDYSGGDTPQMFGGVVGKLFGQFGTYSSGYRAAMMGMFRYGSPAKRVEMVATYLAISGLLYAGFDAMRIKTNDFVPGNAAIFGGGKTFNMGIDAMKSLGTGYEAKQARSSLLRELPTLIPGSAQLGYLKKSFEYADAGDDYAAFLSLFSTPVVPLK